MCNIPATDRSPTMVLTTADELLIHNPPEIGIVCDPENGVMVTPDDTLNVPLVNVRNPGDNDEKLFDVTSNISLELEPTFTFIE